MAKWVDAAVLDMALTEIARAGRMIAVAGQPAGYGAAVNSLLADVALEAGDFALSDAGAGRQIRVAGKTGVPVAAAGIADHVALVDDQGARLLYVTTCPPQALLPGGNVNFDPWSVEIGSPV